ncbi:MAG: hypothetical protein WBQ17_08655 [Rhizomicrobium sp.]|jgi:hypothetical protein
MNNLVKLAGAAVIGASALALTTAGASAAVVCNANGTCWHTHHAYMYRPEFGVVVHPNGWRWGAGDHYTWREHRGRGYWHNGVWITF